ncbi:hypothetical protein [Methylocapsa aurea]|uniref:hypothetical protein n=1 Tax=Methylocapsa aurea TaxID=663610 RepID=UPI00056CC01C|nr:hypothetical protein [Methylocapsa aurea]
MMDKRPTPADDAPASEPEIIPPDRFGGYRSDDGQGRSRAPIFIDERGGHRIYVAKIGPLGVILLSLLIGVVVIAALVLLLGAMLIWIPFVALLVAAGMIGSLMRAYFSRRL